MRYLHLLLGIIAFIGIIIVFFQVLTFPVSQRIPFFTTRLELDIMFVYISIISFVSGVFLTLGIKGILESGKDFDDGFDL